MVKKLRLLMAALLVMIAASVQAQVTTSSMSGRVTDAEGAVIGATVIATHEPSGTTYGTVTNMEGRFNLNGMRVGGPYTVEISYVGYGTSTTSNIALSLGENYVLNVLLTEEVTTLDEVVVTALRTKFTTEKTGAATNITNAQIDNLPTVSRSIMDITRLSPYGGNGMSFVGTDGRTANFTVDGANFNNNFGLSSALPGGDNYYARDNQLMRVISGDSTGFVAELVLADIDALTESGGAYGSSSNVQATRKLSSLEVGGIHVTNHVELKNNKDNGTLLPVKTTYYIVTNDAVYPATRKGMESMLPDHAKSDLRRYVKQHNVKWNRPETLHLLLDFLKELPNE
jgi:hypothetical protein